MAYSKHMHLASAPLNLLLRETFREIDTSKLGDAYVSRMFDQTFLRHLMFGVNRTHKPFAEIARVRNKHPNLCAMLDACERYMGNRNFYSIGAVKYLTTLKNNYATGSTRWIKRWVYLKVKKQLATTIPPWDYKMATKALVYHLHNWKLSHELGTVLDVLTLDLV
eukprot:scaffold348_cov329-Pavlova_lutheri.AAC.17